MPWTYCEHIGTGSNSAKLRPHVRRFLFLAGAGARFLWVDIEDDSELVDDLEVETFPTLLIGQGERVCFIGPVLPGPAAAQRLIQAAQDNPAMSAASPNAPPGTTAAAQSLLSRLRQSC